MPLPRGAVIITGALPRRGFSIVDFVVDEKGRKFWWDKDWTDNKDKIEKNSKVLPQRRQG